MCPGKLHDTKLRNKMGIAKISPSEKGVLPSGLIWQFFAL